VGLGWIGLHRLQSLLQEEIAEVVAICDPDADAMEAATQVVPQAHQVRSLDELWTCELDGVVIATPSALHAAQALAALRNGKAVFCQKPLARTAVEARQIVDAAREANLLLEVDFCYRHVTGVEQMRRVVRSGELGEIFCIDLTFHNAYGPDKAWFYTSDLSGGGCVIDLGIHLVDLTGWITGEWGFEDVRSTLWRQGRPMTELAGSVEECAIAEWRQPSGAGVRLACSWNLSAGQDAVIEARFYGTRGAVALRNLEGSFFDFLTEHYVGTQRHVLKAAGDVPVDTERRNGAPFDENHRDSETVVGKNAWDAWGGKALIQWTKRLTEACRFDEGIVRAVSVAELLDAIYARESDRPLAPMDQHHPCGAVVTTAEAHDRLP
jgi:predicted dehydrogenase